MIHRQHLSRHLPAALPLEGCQRGDVFYCGPPRRGAGNCWLTAGMQGEVIEAGLIEGLRTRSVVECRALVERCQAACGFASKAFRSFAPWSKGISRRILHRAGGSP